MRASGLTLTELSKCAVFLFLRRGLCGDGEAETMVLTVEVLCVVSIAKSFGRLVELSLLNLTRWH